MELSAIRVFVVEDHAFQRGGIVNMLRAIGIQNIREAANGLDALAALTGGQQEPPPDVILCDLDMPEMDGIEFLRAVAERKLARSVIIVSGRESDILRSVETMARVSGLVVLGRLEKPASPDTLRQLLSGNLVVAPIVQRDPQPALDAAELRRALEAREFHAEFQPKINLVTGAIVGVEALARWVRWDAIAVPPGEFVPAMVREGLITQLTELMLDDACHALPGWEAVGVTLDAAVNLSMTTLSDLKTADRFMAQVHAHGIAPDRILFEVTETEVMADVARVLNVLTRLRLKGFRLSLDDFGTGYSSLSQLNTLPFNEIKIDRTFVHNCARSRRLRSIVESSIDLARRLGARTVGEGVETREEWDLLRAAGCDEAQGFYIAPAMPAVEIPAWVAGWAGQTRAEA